MYPDSERTHQMYAAAALFGQLEAIISLGILPPALEESSRLLLADAVAAFRMKTRAESEELERELA